MINKDSIVTAYDEHLTLVEWLMKTEKALNESVLTNLGIAKLSEQGNIAIYQVTATFADNTTIVSNTFTLPSTDIVTAFNDLTALVNGFDDRITDNTNDIASIIDIIDIGNDKIKASTLQNSINGSDEVIVDIDATNDKLKIHLSAELQAKLARVLLKPSSAPTTRKVVTIDTNGAQDNVDPTQLPTLMANIVDSHGNKRFVEGNGTPASLEGLTITYNKWSLSGTHLMIVIYGEITANTDLTGKSLLNLNDLPNFIKDKLFVSFSYDAIDFKNFNSYVKSSLVPSINIPVLFIKDNTGIRVQVRGSGYTLPTADTDFRIQFDVLIDNG